MATGGVMLFDDLSLYQIPPSYGAHVRAAKMAAFGSSASSSRRVLASTRDNFESFTADSGHMAA
jgi:hypothetical protein